MSAERVTTAAELVTSYVEMRERYLRNTADASHCVVLNGIPARIRQLTPDFELEIADLWECFAFPSGKSLYTYRVKDRAFKQSPEKYLNRAIEAKLPVRLQAAVIEPDDMQESYYSDLLDYFD